MFLFLLFQDLPPAVCLPPPSALLWCLYPTPPLRFGPAPFAGALRTLAPGAPFTHRPPGSQALSRGTLCKLTQPPRSLSSPLGLVPSAHHFQSISRPASESTEPDRGSIFLSPLPAEPGCSAAQESHGVAARQGLVGAKQRALLPHLPGHSKQLSQPRPLNGRHQAHQPELPSCTGEGASA